MNIKNMLVMVMLFIATASITARAELIEGLIKPSRSLTLKSQIEQQDGNVFTKLESKAVHSRINVLPRATFAFQAKRIGHHYVVTELWCAKTLDEMRNKIAIRDGSEQVIQKALPILLPVVEVIKIDDRAPIPIIKIEIREAIDSVDAKTIYSAPMETKSQVVPIVEKNIVQSPAVTVASPTVMNQPSTLRYSIYNAICMEIVLPIVAITALICIVFMLLEYACKCYPYDWNIKSEVEIFIPAQRSDQVKCRNKPPSADPLITPPCLFDGSLQPHHVRAKHFF